MHDLHKVPGGYLKVAPTGSRYICNPSPTDTDEDYVVLVKCTHDYIKKIISTGGDGSGIFDYRSDNE